jgi:adenylate cyclase
VPRRRERRRAIWARVCGSGFAFHAGFWGAHVGFYGGINYGFGYAGVGFAGGYWAHGAFFYNRAVNNFGNTHITNVYNKNVTINRTTNVSYNGGAGGIQSRPTSEELGVRYVLEGSVRKAGGRVRVNAQLIDTASGAHVWADRFDRELTDIFAVQDELTDKITSALKIRLTASERALLVSGGTKNADAHDLFLKRRELIMGNQKNREVFEQSVACFQRGIELDPNYAAPYAGLGMAYMFDYQNHWSDAAEKSLDKAQRFIEGSIARDDKDPYAYYVAALISFWKRDLERSTEEVDKALSLNPNHPLALVARGNVDLYSGEPARAIPYYEKAIRLDPGQSQYRHFLASAYFVAGAYETAAAIFKERIALTPNTDLSRAFLASALGHLGRPDDAQPSG